MLSITALRFCSESSEGRALMHAGNFRQRPFVQRTPIGRRILSVGAIFACCFSGSLVRAEPLTEADVVRISKATDPNALAARETAAVAEAEQVRASLYPNPSLSWDREHVPSGVVGRERTDNISLTLPIEISGRRFAGMALARSEVASARARAARSQSDSVVLALLRFYEALAASGDVEIASLAVARLDEAARVLGSRRQAGATSGYESTRLEIEAELARSQLRQAEIRAQAALTELALLLGLDAQTVTLQGDLSTMELSDAGTVTPASRPSARLMGESEAEAREAHLAARWSWVPSVSLTGGLRIQETDDTRYGYVAGVSLSLPVFSSGQDVRAEASARQRLVAAQRSAAEREATIASAGARQELLATREELSRFEAATRQRVERLDRAAESGYREGERSIVELVDAQRARTEVARRRLELQLACKRAELTLRAAGGEFE